jgi:tetratricopeptide (TPR) repeat protein
MAKKGQQEETIVDVQEVYTKTEMFIDKHRNTIFGVVGVAALLIAGYYAFTKLYLQPREEKASAEMWMAQVYFSEESYEAALIGDDTFPGFEEITEKYGSTNAGKLAHYYMGIIYRDRGGVENYEIALDHFLRAAKLNDDAVGPMATGNAGDMYVELGDYGNALKYFEKAANRADNTFISALYLMKAARLCIIEEKTKEAKGYLKKIIDNYPESNEFKEAEKYLASIGG